MRLGVGVGLVDVEVRVLQTSSFVPMHQTHVVDRTHPRGELLLVDPLGVERLFDDLERREPPGEQVVVDEPLVLLIERDVLGVGGGIEPPQPGSASSASSSRI